MTVMRQFCDNVKYFVDVDCPFSANIFKITKNNIQTFNIYSIHLLCNSFHVYFVIYIIIGHSEIYLSILEV